MPCYKPISAYRQLNPEDGKRTIVFGRAHLKNYDIAQQLDLPCGQCIGCRLETSREWAIRIVHETKQHKANSFLTLTYDQKSLPKDGSLNVEHFQLFMKRLREWKRREAKKSKKGSGLLKFFHCGEYGETTGRPHYHACIFGEDFLGDREFYKTTDAGHNLYLSRDLERLWGMGQCQIGELTFESAAYVARYSLKKITGKKHSESYGEYSCYPPLWKRLPNDAFEPLRGYAKQPEYITMSRNPGIGSTWLQKWKDETYRSDSIVMRGHEMMPPKAYDRLLEKIDPALFESIKKQRAKDAEEFADGEDSRSRRLIEREQVKLETVKNTLRRRV